MAGYIGRRPKGRPRKDGAISKWVAYIPQPTEFSVNDLPKNPLLDELVMVMPQIHYKRILSDVDLVCFAKVFEDEQLIATALYYIFGGMKVAETSKNIYMHRNTLMYRLDKIKAITGLDIRNFNQALTFLIIHRLYLKK